MKLLMRIIDHDSEDLQGEAFHHDFVIDTDNLDEVFEVDSMKIYINRLESEEKGSKELLDKISDMRVDLEHWKTVAENRKKRLEDR